MQLLRSTATVGGLTMISRVTGFVRDMLIATVLGAGPVSDAFFVAFKLPNFFRRITAEGSLSVAFIPVFTSLLAGEGPAAARRFLEDVTAVVLAVLIAASAAAIIAMPQVLTVLAPGFAATPSRFELAVELCRITFVYLPLISAMALLAGALNGMQRFAAAACAPILLNVILIGAMALFADRLETPAHVLAWAVMISGVAQLAWVAAAAGRHGMIPRLRRPSWTPGVARLFRLMVPAMLGAAVIQINLVIDVVLASLLAEGSISFLYYADRVTQLPLGVVGVAIGTVLLPTLSAQMRRGEIDAANRSRNDLLLLGMLLTLPAAGGLAILAAPVIGVLFERGAFTATETTQTAAAMAAYAVGLPAFVAVKVLQPVFFAREDTRTPVTVAAISVGLNLVLNLILMQFFAHVGLAMATSIAAWFNAGVLTWLLQREGIYGVSPRTWDRIARLLAATLVMAVVLILADRLVPPGQGPWLEVAQLAALIGGGALVYAAAVLLFGGVRLGELRGYLAR